MRQLYVRVPRGHWEEVLDLAGDLGAVNTARLEAETREEWDLILLHIPNDAVDELLESLEALPDFRATLQPTGVLAFHHPGYGEAMPFADLSPRSPVEVLLQRRLQIPNAWVFVTFAVITGAIVWIGLYEEIVYLLTGAMLVAPFAAPALNAGAATATGDTSLLIRSWGRYAVGVILTIAAAAVLTLISGLSVPTGLAIDVASLSTFVLLLPLAAGVAGSLFVLTTEEASTVSGAAVSMLVAAAIAPPAGVAGMALVTGEWSLLLSVGLVLVAQLVGINLVSAVVFRWYRMTPRRPAFTEGSSGIFAPVVAVTAIALVVLFATQLVMSSTLRQIDIRRDIVDGVHAALDPDPSIGVVDVEVRQPARDAGYGFVATVWVRDDARDGQADVERVTAVLLEHLDTAIRDQVLLDVEVVVPAGSPP